MAQLAPSSLQYGQLMALVRSFTDDYTKGKFKNSEEVIEQISEIIRQFNEIAGKPMLELEAFDLGEPTDSVKMNRVWTTIENDVNLVQDQLNVLKAAVVFLHNFIATEVQLAKNQNAQVSNKLKTLQLYTNGQNNGILQFGDYFSNLDFIDQDLTANVQKCHT